MLKKNNIVRYIKRLVKRRSQDYNPLGVTGDLSNVSFIDVGCRNAIPIDLLKGLGHYNGWDADYEEIIRLKDLYTLENTEFHFGYVGSENEKVRYYRHQDGNYNGTFFTSPDYIDVETTALDSIISAIDLEKYPVICLDIDTEGSALQVIKQSTLLSKCSAVSIEGFVNMSGKSQLGELAQILEKMDDCGFSLVGVAKTSYREKCIIPNGINFCDLLFVKTEIYKDALEGHIYNWLHVLYGFSDQTKNRGIKYYLGETLIQLGLRLRFLKGGTVSDRDYLF